MNTPRNQTNSKYTIVEELDVHGKLTVNVKRVVSGGECEWLSSKCPDFILDEVWLAECFLHPGRGMRKSNFKTISQAKISLTRILRSERESYKREIEYKLSESF